MESEEIIESLFCDGGVYPDGNGIPSASCIGGMWAYCYVNKKGERVHSNCGTVKAGYYGLERITNNLSELLAAVKGMEGLPDGWAGTIYTDSQVTMFRIRNHNPSFLNIPKELVARVWAQRKRLGKYKVVLLQGHPTIQDLKKGIGAKRGLPVSEHNVYCDAECNRIAYLFKKEEAKEPFLR